MWCAACSKPVDRAARFCDQCGAAQHVVALPSAPAELARYGSTAASSSRQSRTAWIAALLLSGAGAALGAAWLLATPQVAGDELYAAVLSAMADGSGPGNDPICVANGLAYDQLPVNVQAGNTLTVSWMDTLVSAGLYDAPEQGVSGGFLSTPILTYRPLPVLAQWAGPRRLCIAKAVKLHRIVNLGSVEDMRLRGKRYTGVPADVVWTLDQPAPWLATPEVGEAFARELPTWRSARWQPAGKAWRLTQRKHFFLVDERWVTSDMAERLDARQPAVGKPMLRDGTLLSIL